MDTLIYFAKAGLIYGLLYSIYFLLFRNNTNFQANRIYLLLIIPFSFILPVINANVQVNTEYNITLPTFEVGTAANNTTANSPENIFLAIYGAVSLVLFLVFAFNLFKTLSTIYSLKKGKKNGIQPFSFFNFIHVPISIDVMDRKAILLHEKVHSEQWHSIDIVIYEISKVVLWWNPLLWMGLNSVKSNHEFIADKLASVKADKYSSVLGVNCSALANNFKSKHLLKKRIMMMKTKQSNKLSLVKYALVLPIIGLTFLASAQDYRVAPAADETNQRTPPVAPITTRTVAPTSPATPEAPSTNQNKRRVLNEVDYQPEFKGGMEGLMKYMGAHVKYPEEAKKNKIEGKVFVAFLVDKDGNVKDATVVKSANKYLDKEALRVIKGMPKWNPAKKDGKNVAAKMTLPVAFKL